MLQVQISGPRQEINSRFSLAALRDEPSTRLGGRTAFERFLEVHIAASVLLFCLSDVYISTFAYR